MKKVFCFLIVLSLLITVSITARPKAMADTLTDSGIDYTESLNSLYNPDRGMFYLYQIFVKDNATNGDILQGSKVSGRLTAPDFARFSDGSYSYAPGTTLFVISFGLEYFSKKAGGSDIELTANALTYIDNTLLEAQNAGVNVIVRFSYDLQGKTYDTKKDCEPSMELMLRHIEQIAPILTKYNGIITAVQSGMFGPWGEQHTTSVSDYDNANNYYQMVEKWLNTTPSDMWILVRRTRFFVHWYNVKYNKNYTTKTINQIVCTKGTPEYRIGCYNDGYLADKTDWDTYANRNEEIEFLSSQTYAPYGGEVCSDASGLNNYNKISFLEVEAFKTHTSFLNYKWDYEKVIKNWEKETYNGADSRYKGKTSSFVYVLNHLGYRLVLRDSKLSNEVSQNGSLSLAGTVENVGFGNIPREQNAYVVIVDSAKKEVLQTLTNIDAQSFLSTKTTPYSANISLNGLKEGSYKAYLRLSGKNQSGQSLRYIAFANDGVYDADLKANYLGSFTVKKSSAPATDSASKSQENSKTQTSKSEINSNQKSSSQKTSTPKASSEETSSLIRRPSKSTSKNSTNQTSENGSKGCKSSANAENILLFALALVVLCFTLLKLKKNN